ncbi:guanine nucleotide binding protein, alpha subunit [Podospora didyma]|uniref:Guanine nucleotide binding protein, alpha subunit n=1 Tax=Podospora didyma TaxID=330526 RepID=A0AAE0NZL1_9PEZI|nr:guanine nucleotide binding protein, alpha subunit [Podospora didyma]
MANLARLFSPDYVPTNEDILRAREITIGIHDGIQYEVKSRLARHMRYTFFDVGGRRPERRKWRYRTDGIDVVLFQAALGAYDEPVAEAEDGIFQMTEALRLWETVCTSALWADAILFLNFTKVDIFEQKILSGSEPLKTYFPTYDGDVGDVNAALTFLKSQFMALTKSQRVVHTHFLDATDTKQVRDMINDIKMIVDEGNARRTGFMHTLGWRFITSIRADKYSKGVENSTR